LLLPNGRLALSFHLFNAHADQRYFEAVKGKQALTTLGPFETEEAAARAYDDAVRPLGRQVNFPLQGEQKVAPKEPMTKGKNWGAWINLKAGGKGERVNIGYYVTEEEAAHAYDEKAR
jgi:hypothetical protein